MLFLFKSQYWLQNMYEGLLNKVSANGVRVSLTMKYANLF